MMENTFKGSLSIATLYGKHGPFNTGILNIKIGKFVVKDKSLEQYDPGRYEGEFTISEIGPHSYLKDGRVIVECRAYIEHMALHNTNHLSDEEIASFSNQLDPVEEENTSVPVTLDKPLESETQSTVSPNNVKIPIDHLDDEELFGVLLWPLGEIVKLDATVDRQLLRRQQARLKELGYKINFKTQEFELLQSF